MKFGPALHSLSIFAVALTQFAFPLKGASQVTTTQPVKTVVFVHGAWADGSSWSKLIPILQSKGLHVVCVQNPLTSFADDVAATKRIIDAQDGPVLLVGHSYGGAIITEAGNNPKVAGLVYVAAFAPDQGESAASQGKPYGPTPGLGELRPIEDGFLILSQKGIQEDFAPDVTAEEQMIMVATQVPTQGAALAGTISAPAWRNKPTWFVIASNDRMISPKQEKDSAAKMNAKTLTLPTSHVPMLSRPKEVAAFISEAASDQSRLTAASK
ncbi:MAG: alpha/beta hydrolase [Terriglobales bacterium]|jgi:pimeloyl-ACP methyl ester carboxylesterase